MNLAERVTARFLSQKVRSAFEKNDDLKDARSSVNALMDRFLKILSQTGDTYRMGASASRGQIFYFFTGKHQLDAFSLVLSAPKEGVAKLLVQYVPFDVHKKPEVAKTVSVQMESEPEMAGLALMRAGKKLLQDLKTRKLIAQSL